MNALSRLKAKIEELKSNYDKLEKENRELKERLKNCGDEDAAKKIANLESRIEQLEDEIEQKDAEIESILENIEELLD